MDESKVASKPAGSEVQVEDASSNAAPIKMLEPDAKEGRSEIGGMDESKLAIKPVGSEVQVEDASSNAAPNKMLEPGAKEARSEIGGMDESKLAIKPVGSEVQVEDASSNAAGNDAPNEMLEADAAEEARSGTGVTASPLTFIGGTGGTQHRVHGWTNGRVITRIRVYSGPNTIKAYTIWFTDSVQVTYGSPERTNFAEYTFQDGERLTSLTLWGNGIGTRAGWIEFTTTRGLRFSYGMHRWSLQTPYYAQLGSGILVGCIFNAGEDIDAHGFYLLNAIDHAELTNVRYPTLGFDAAGIIPRLLDRFEYTNNSSTSRDWDFTRTMSEGTEQTWSVTVDVTVHATLTVSAGIPLVAEVSGQFGWQVGATGHYEKTQTSEQQFQWSVRGTVQPGHSVDLKAVTRMGTINTQYQGTMVVRLRNGSSFSYPITGRYRGVSYTGVQIIDDSTR